MRIIKIDDRQYARLFPYTVNEGFVMANNVIVVYKNRRNGGEPCSFNKNDFVNLFSKCNHEFIDKDGDGFYLMVDGGVEGGKARVPVSVSSVRNGYLSSGEVGELGKFSGKKGYVYKKESGRDTREIYDRNGKLVTVKTLLPYSRLVCFSIFTFKNTDFVYVLKHGKTKSGNKVDIRGVFRMGVWESERIIDKLRGDKAVDVITYVDSSSPFNRYFAQTLHDHYKGSSLVKDIAVKSPENMRMNDVLARNCGMSDSDIEHFYKKLGFVAVDEQVRKILEELNEELKSCKYNPDKEGDAARKATELMARCNNRIQKLVEDGGRRVRDVVVTTGYPFETQDDINNIKFDFKKAFRYDETSGKWYFNNGSGKFVEINKPGDCFIPYKNWQMKSVRGVFRQFIVNLYVRNDKAAEEVGGIRGKLVVVVDDNISHGSTLDNFCHVLQEMGAGKIIPLTFGDMGKTFISPSERKAAQDGNVDYDRPYGGAGSSAASSDEIPCYIDKIDGKYYFMKARIIIDKNGNRRKKKYKSRLCKYGFDDCGSFNYGFAKVYLKKVRGRKNYGWNFIDKDGKFLSKEWFWAVRDFEGSAAYVMDKNGKGWYIDNRGNKHDSDEFRTVPNGA